MLLLAFDENAVRVAHLVKEPDPKRVIFQRNQIHRAFIKWLNRQYNTRAARPAIRFDCNPIVDLHKILLWFLSQCRTKQENWQRVAARLTLLSTLYALKLPDKTLSAFADPNWAR